MNAAVLPMVILAASSPDAPQRWDIPAISSDQYESSPTFTPDGRELYFMRSDRRFTEWRILQSRCVDGAWSTPVEAPFAASLPARDADPFVTADGKHLYFVSTRQNRDGGEQLDIWRVQRDAAGEWSDPERLPEPVNSAGSELMPREDAAGRLWFGSDRPGGFGQGDIYVATPQAGNGWRVENAAPPISTAAYEYEADPSRDGHSLVVVANRGTRSHLYRYRLVDSRWIELGRVTAYDSVFQVGPLHSPDGRRLLFAQADGERSGELFVTDLDRDADRSWPPRCATD